MTASAAVRSLKAAGLRVSATANLVRIRRGVGERRCEALLGVGHVHRREGRGNMVIRRREALGCASDAQCNRMRAEKAKAKGKGKGRGRRSNKGRRLAEAALPPKGRRLARRRWEAALDAELLAALEWLAEGAEAHLDELAHRLPLGLWYTHQAPSSRSRSLPGGVGRGCMGAAGRRRRRASSSRGWRSRGKIKARRARLRTRRGDRRGRAAT